MIVIIEYIFLLAIIALTLVSLWFCFKKAGEKGWKALVPFYNYYTLYKISGMKGSFVAVNILAFCFDKVKDVIKYILQMSMMNYMSNNAYVYALTNSEIIEKAGLKSLYSIFLIISFLVIAIDIAELVVTIILDVKFCKAFGLGGGYIALMILVPVVCIPIIAFNKNIKYVGNEKDNNTNNNENSRSGQNSVTLY